MKLIFKRRFVDFIFSECWVQIKILTVLVTVHVNQPKDYNYNIEVYLKSECSSMIFQQKFHCCIFIFTPWQCDWTQPTLGTGCLLWGQCNIWLEKRTKEFSYNSLTQESWGWWWAASIACQCDINIIILWKSVGDKKSA